MSQKRLLLLHEDRLLGKMWRENLEAAGYAVAHVRAGDAGLKIATKQPPDAIVIDPVLPGGKLDEIIVQLRRCGEDKALPVVALPTSRPLLAEMAHDNGAIILPRGKEPIADVIEALREAFGLEKTAGAAIHVEQSWVKTCLAEMPEAVVAMRHGLHEISRTNGEEAALAGFLHLVHGFSEQMALIGQRSLHSLATQIEALAFDLARFPEQLNPSVLRTLGQAVDFLATLLPQAVRSRLNDPSAAQVLVVDDEDGARKIIMAAMRLANLKSMAADTPTTGLAALGVQGFDLIFLDVGLPEMNGFELCAKVRALPLHEKTPIIFITGMATFQNRVQSSLSGGNDFVGKPFSIAELGLKALTWVFKGQLGQL